MADGPGVEGPLPWNPKVAVAPAGRLGAQAGPLIVQVLPLGVMTAFQALPSVTPGGAVQVTVQLFHGVAPVFRTLTLALKAPFQESVT
jgi:hypothetical protein